MKKLLSNNQVLFWVSAGIFSVGITASVFANNFQWVSRFSSLIICCGIIALARPNLIGKDIKFDVIKAETGLSDLSREHYEKLGIKVPDWVVEDEKSRFAVGVLGPLLCLIGTSVNGFGDLVNKFFGW